MRRTSLTLAVLVLLLPSPTSGERLPIRAYTTADGLAHNEINKIVRDSRGFLWFATSDGLSRFDGHGFSNYSVDQGLPHGTVTGFLETKNGELWVATFGGLVRFHPDGTPGNRVVGANEATAARPMFATITPDDDDPRARAIIVLFESRDGTIWCGTRKGLFRLERSRDRFVLRFVDLGLPKEYSEQEYINDLVEDEHGSLWAASASGLYRLWRDGTVARYSAPGFMRSDHLHDLMRDHEGHIWVGMRYDGFFRIAADASHRPPRIVEHHAYPGLGASWVNQLLETSDHRFWVGSALGLVEFVRNAPKGSEFVSYNRRHGLILEQIATLAEDGGGNIWMGTWSGAMKLARNGFVTYGRQDGVAAGIKLLEDATGDLYVLAHIFKPGHPYNLPSSPTDEHVELQFGRFDGRRFQWFVPGPPYLWGWIPEGSIVRARNGEVWLAGGRGLFRYPPLPSLAALRTARPKQVLGQKNGVILGQVFRIFEDALGNVWFSINGVRNYLFRWNRETDSLTDMAAVPGFPSVQDELPRAFAEDRGGNIWVGFNTGVARFRGGRFSFYTAADGLAAGAIGQIHAAADGRVWLASSRSGLITIEDPAADRPSFKRYTTDEGLSGNRIEAVTEDRFGRIYAATGRGIDQLDPGTGIIKHFTTEDGLASGWTLAAFRDRTGELWFGTHTGLSRFRPEEPKRSPPPEILITGVSAEGTPRRVSAVGETRMTLADLAPDRNQLQIDFASLSFAAGDRLRYEYKLEGGDTEWGAPTTRRTVSYASLAPGTYRFLVRAINADGVSSTEPAVVAFRVLPPFWLRWWFLALTALTVAGAAVALHRYRLARILELERVRTRIATDLHDDVGANLTRIAILSEVARQKRQGVGGNLDVVLSSIGDISRESVTTMSDIVWAISPERDTLRDMVRRMRDHAEEVFESRDIRVTFDMPDAAQTSQLGVNTRRDLYLIFKEAVNNAARHSGCTYVRIALRAEGSRLELEIADNGVGFDLGDHSEGHGVVSMKRRAARLGAALEVLTRTGAGTTVRLTMTVRDWQSPVMAPTRTGR